MPAQSPAIARAYYAENDTAPNLRRRLLDGAGDPIDLGVAPDEAEVFIDIGHSSYDYYYSPMTLIVDSGPCVLEDQADPDHIGYVQWAPQAGDLTPPGNMQFRFKIVYADGTVQHIPPHTYETLIITTPVGGVGQ
jgi:hypothetical protein